MEVNEGVKTWREEGKKYSIGLNWFPNQEPLQNLQIGATLNYLRIICWAEFSRSTIQKSKIPMSILALNRRDPRTASGFTSCHEHRKTGSSSQCRQQKWRCVYRKIGFLQIPRWWVLTARGEPLLSLEAKGIYNRAATARFEHIPVANRANINDFRRWWRRSLVGRSRSLGRDNKGGKYWWCWWVRCCPITFFCHSINDFSLLVDFFPWQALQGLLWDPK